MEEVLSTTGPHDRALDQENPGSRKRKRGRHAAACESCHRRKQRVSDISQCRFDAWQRRSQQQLMHHVGRDHPLHGIY